MFAAVDPLPDDGAVQAAQPVNVVVSGVNPPCVLQQNCRAWPVDAVAAAAAGAPARHTEQSLNNFQVLYLNALVPVGFCVPPAQHHGAFGKQHHKPAVPPQTHHWPLTPPVPLQL